MDEQSEKQISDEINNRVKEEFAADFAYSDPNIIARSEVGRHMNERDIVHTSYEGMDTEVSSSSNYISIIGIVFAVASWFLWPILMAVTAIVLGFIAYATESKKWSITAIVLGSMTIAYQFIVIPILMTMF